MLKTGFLEKKAIYTIEEVLEKWENYMKKPRKYHCEKLNSMLSVDCFFFNFSIIFLEKMTTNPMRIFETDNLDEEYDFRQMTLSQKTVFVEMIFKRQRDLVKESFHDGLLKTLIFAELNAAERNHKLDIVF